MVGFKLLLLLFQAPCSGYELKLKALLFERIPRHDEVFVDKAHLILGEWKIITVLRVFVHDLFIRAESPIFPFVLFGSWLNGVFIVCGIVQSIIFPCAVIAFFL